MCYLQATEFEPWLSSLCLSRWAFPRGLRYASFVLRKGPLRGNEFVRLLTEVATTTTFVWWK